MSLPRLRHGRRFRPRIGALLAVVVFVPTAGMVSLSVSAAQDRRQERDLAAHVEAEAKTLEGLMTWRSVINDEWVLGSAVHSAGVSGLSAADVSELVGVDLAGDLAAARRGVDAEARRAEHAEFASYLPDVARARQIVDRGDPDARPAMTAAFQHLTDALDRAWQSRLERLRDAVERSASSRRPGELFQRLDALEGSFGALVATMARGDYAHMLLTGERSTANYAGLFDSSGRYESATDDIQQVLGPHASAAWLAWRADPATRRAEAIIDGFVDAFVDGADVPSVDLDDYASLLTDGVRWLDGVTQLITAAAVDLAELAERRHDAATASMITVGVAAGAVALAALVAGALLTRSVARPLRELADFAHDVGEGDFDRPAPPSRGPRELAQTTEAVTDMATTVSAVEDFVIQLARDAASPALDIPLPGRTGRALQATVDQLRHSMREAERHRRRLEVVASQDGLTGLLNRTAALAAIERELAICRRSGGVFAVVFVDLDGLKAINDAHGHEVGDAAIRHTAQALVASTRRTDVVARLGGDEFLVALSANDGRDEAARVAERIRRTVAEQPLGLPDGQLALRCSIGVALAGPGESAESVINHADKALYRAKAQGRNRICWFHVPDHGALC